MIKAIIRKLLLVLAWLGGILLLLCIIAALRIALYRQTDNPTHLKAKEAYLHRIAKISNHAADRPNIIIVLYDDLGYGDLGATGSKVIATPNIDQLAQQGVRLDEYYSPAPICTPSRYGLLTGRFAERGGLSLELFPPHNIVTLIQKVMGENTRIPANEITLADALKAAGYRTGMIGKWNLGDHSPSLPNDMGFDYFFGALYSNDMQPFALYLNRKIEYKAPADQTLLSQRYADAASNFIRKNAGKPFFLYLAHNFPHQPLHVRKSRLGKSAAGLYGDVVHELDDGIGQLVASLKAAGVYDNTLIIITSDNGPWFQGDPGHVRGRKGQVFEGGMHVPFIASWPGHFPDDRIMSGMAMGTDIFPTMLDLLHLPAPTDRILDGKSLLSMLEGNSGSPHKYLYYFSGQLFSVRDANYKFMPRRGITFATAQGPVSPKLKEGPYLFNLQDDPNESYDVSAHQPAELQRLQAVYEKKVREMEVNRPGWK